MKFNGSDNQVFESFDDFFAGEVLSYWIYFEVVSELSKLVKEEESKFSCIATVIEPLS